MHSFEPSFIQARLRYHDLPGAGAPILFVHGLGCASSLDYPQVAHDPSLRGRRILLVDLLGSGFSDRPEDFGYSVQDHARVIAELIDRLGGPVCLVGHSMGGAIAISAASLRAAKIARLVLSEPNLDPGGGTFSRTIGGYGEEEYRARGHAAAVQEAHAKGNDLWAISMSLSLPVAIHREAVSLIQGSAPTWREQLSALHLPRTMIFGELSLPDPDTEWLAGQGIRISVVPAAGHSMAWENPSGLARAISGALD